MAADFGTRLRVQRESRGLTLEDVATSTKIKVSLLADLERNDVSRWPQGIYGRAFLRAYADAVGISPGLLLDHLLTKLGAPGDQGRTPAAAASPRTGPAGLRLTFAPGAAKPRLAAAQLIDAAIVLAAVLAAGAIAAVAAGVAFLTASAVVALVWYPVAHAIFGGCSPSRVLRGRRPTPTADAAGEVVAAAPPLRIVAPSVRDDGSPAVAEEPLRQAL